ncbi:MAG: hypothetical protein KBT36_07225, partial [Kurthia sp.]|nr:hypothetical protein [Candidatus Kurthia equi]
MWKNKSFQNINRYPCPYCNTGILIGQNTPIKHITNEGKFNEKYNHPNGVIYAFSGMLKCSNEKCKDVVAVIGEYTDVHISNQDEYGNPLEFNLGLYQPKNFYPN